MITDCVKRLELFLWIFGLIPNRSIKQSFYRALVMKTKDPAQPGLHASPNGSVRCKQCHKYTDGPCIAHNRRLADRPFLPRAFATLPQELEIRLASQLKTDDGVFVNANIEEACIFGPLCAPLSRSPENGIFQYGLRDPDGNLLYYQLDSDDACNWMKYVRLADTTSSANTIAFPQDNGVYFVTGRTLKKGEELRVCYSAIYAKAIGKLSSITICEENELNGLPNQENEVDLADLVTNDNTEENTGDFRSDFPPELLVPPLLSTGADSESLHASEKFDLPGYFFTVPVGSEPVSKPRETKARPGQNVVRKTRTGKRTGPETSSVVDVSESWVSSDVGRLIQGLPKRRKNEVPPVDVSGGDPPTLDLQEDSIPSSSNNVKKARQARNQPFTVEERLEMVISVNPFQHADFSPERSAAWSSVWDELICANPARLLRTRTMGRSEGTFLRDMVTNLLNHYQPNSIPSEATRTERDDLVRQVYELKMASVVEPPARISRSGTVPFKSRVRRGNGAMLVRLKAIWAANPFQYAPDAVEFETAWLTAVKTVEEQLGGTAKGGSSTERGRLHTLLQRSLTTWKPNGLDSQSVTPLTERDKVVQALYEQILQQDPETVDQPITSGGRPKLRDDQKRPHAAYPFRCDQCPTDFRTIELFQVHALKHGKETGVDQTVCPECSFTASTTSKLISHVDRHRRHIYSPRTPHQCPQCHRHYNSAESLAKHTARLHREDSANRQFECSICQKRFIFLASMKSHQRTHSVRKFFECPVCLLGLEGAMKMQQHTETHRGEDGVFHCGLCPKTYPEFHLLKRHLPDHATRTHACDVCQRIFKRRLIMERHKLVHSTDFPYQCETCGRKFKRREKYEDHKVRLHNPDRVYKLKERSEKVAKAFASAEICQFCTRQYSSFERLLLHQREKHLERMPPELRGAGATAVKTADTSSGTNSESE